MFHSEALRFSFQALQANKFRAFLTALGLVIGNASVILVVTISLTSRDYILDHMRAAIIPPMRPRRRTTSKSPTWMLYASNWARASWPLPA
jgi:hypothetical protein